MSEKEEEVRLAGRTISRGVVMGSAFVYREILESLEPWDVEEHQIEEDCGALKSRSFRSRFLSIYF